MNKKRFLELKLSLVESEEHIQIVVEFMSTLEFNKNASLLDIQL